MIKDALLELLQNTPYEKITVTALCKQSEITRATFYLHYNNIDNVLDELLDDALRLTELDAIQPLPSAISNRSIENEKNIEERNPDPDALLPACQRAASNPKYRILFLDESLSHHMLRKLYQMQKPQRIPEIMRDYHLNEWEAEKIFLYMLHGNFAVNKSLGWDKNEDWYHIQKVIKRLLNPRFWFNFCSLTGFHIDLFRLPSFSQNFGFLSIFRIPFAASVHSPLFL